MEIKTIDLIINCPDIESVKAEILANSKSTIQNYGDRLKREIPKSVEETEIDTQITAIHEKNEVKPIVEPVEEII